MFPEKPFYGTTFLNPLNNIQKNTCFKNVSDAGDLNSNTDQSSESGPPEPLPTQLARANKKPIYAIDLRYEYAHATLDD